MGSATSKPREIPVEATVGVSVTINGSSGDVESVRMPLPSPRYTLKITHLVVNVDGEDPFVLNLDGFNVYFNGSTLEYITYRDLVKNALRKRIANIMVCFSDRTTSLLTSTTSVMGKMGLVEEFFVQLFKTHHTCKTHPVVLCPLLWISPEGLNWYSSPSGGGMFKVLWVALRSAAKGDIEHLEA